MKRILYSLLFVLAAPTLVSTRASAQNISYAEKVRRYIAAYKDLAMQEQQRSGVPAAITLAQGILESGAGESELATNAGNHFGIKCKKDWTGETYNHDDDAPEECFRKYASAEHSYRDHSDFLKSAGRYAPCFAQSTTDYAAWAYQLKTCGYATSPTYAQRLIKIIEDYKLQQYTYAALDSQDPLRFAQAGEVVPENDREDEPAPTAAAPVLLGEKPAPTTARTEASRVSAHSETPEEARVRGQQARMAANTDAPAVAAVAADGTTTKDGRRGFYARKGDVLLENAIRYRIRYAKLLEINGLPDEPLSADRFIYLEKATTTRIEHDVAVIAARDETARVASGTSLRNHDVPAAATMVASTAGMVPEPKPKAAEIPAPVVEEVRNEPEAEVAENTKAASATNAATESTQEPDASAESEGKMTASAPAATTERSAEPNTQTDVQIAAATPERTADRSSDAQALDGATPIATPVETSGAAPIENMVGVAKSDSQPTPPAASDGFNIAGESAVEERAGEEDGRNKAKQAAEPEEPKDEMSRLKARFDKAVYAPVKPAAKPVVQSAPAPPPAVPVKAAPVAASSAPGAKFYTVQKGDTAFGIAKKHGITVRQLQEWNGLSMDAGLPLGKKLKVQP